MIYNERMEIKRFFVENDREIKVGDEITVVGDEFVHAIKVSHYKVGYVLILSNGDGYDYFAHVTAVCKDSFSCLIDRAEKNGNELKRPLALYLCAIEKSDLAVQKATEVGATEIHLMISKYTNAKVQNLDRLRKIALESAKQCGRAVVPKIFPTVSLEEGIKDATTRFPEVIFCYELATDGRIVDVVNAESAGFALVVGSEGGFDKEEVVFAESLGVKTVTLGKRILRAETACIAGLVLLADQMERYEDSGN